MKTKPSLQGTLATVFLYAWMLQAWAFPVVAFAIAFTGYWEALTYGLLGAASVLFHTLVTTAFYEWRMSEMD